MRIDIIIPNIYLDIYPSLKLLLKNLDSIIFLGIIFKRLTAESLEMQRRLQTENADHCHQKYFTCRRTISACGPRVIANDRQRNFSATCEFV